MDGESVGENVYLSLIHRAERFLYITTPYLIIDNELTIALSLAAKGGTDVRIITPHRGDNFFVHAATRAYYRQLIECGVKIYEYTPGFIHSKCFVADDRYAVVEPSIWISGVCIFTLNAAFGCRKRDIAE